MRSRVRVALMAAALPAFAFSARSYGQNLLLDPSFEAQLSSPTNNGVGGWSTFNNAAFSNKYAHTGVESMYTPPDGGNYSVPGAYQLVPGVAGGTYTLSGYVDTPDTLVTGSNDFAYLQISWFPTATGGTAISVVDVPIGTPAGTPPANTVALPANTWTYASETAVAPAGTESVGVYLLDINADTNSDFYFDDVSLTASVPEPATMGLVSLIGLPLLRRRRR